MLATDSTSRLVKGAYKNQLCSLAEDLGKRFLPAFNTPTGLPYAWINLKVPLLLMIGFDISYPSFCLGTFMRKFCTWLQMWIYQ